MVNKEMIKSIEKLIELSREKIVKGIKIESDEFNVEHHFKKIVSEIDEIKKQFKKDNAIFLEDALSSAFSDYVLFLGIMEKTGYIRSMDNVFERAFKKREEVCGYLFGIDKENTNENIRKWFLEELKEKEKAELEKRTKRLYGKKNKK